MNGQSLVDDDIDGRVVAFGRRRPRHDFEDRHLFSFSKPVYVQT
jgi:hypothetical protein